jgi:hypothetical protein
MKKIFIVLICIATSLALHSQTVEFTGKVLTFNEVPLVNASVKVSSSDMVVKTDRTGTFTCQCASKDKLIVSANGFIKKSVKIKNNVTTPLIINLKLSSKQKSLDTAIKSGHIVDVIGVNLLVNQQAGGKDYSKYNTMMELLKNEFPSLVIRNNTVLIRGRSSIKLSNSAGIEIDGVLSDFGILKTMAPHTIAKIEIIKGSEAARYGMNGTNGIIVIKTKKE